jgi:hypothetical protein
MKINTKFLTMLAVFALLAFVPLALAQKGGHGKPGGGGGGANPDHVTVNAEFLPFLTDADGNSTGVGAKILNPAGPTREQMSTTSGWFYLQATDTLTFIFDEYLGNAGDGCYESGSDYTNWIEPLPALPADGVLTGGHLLFWPYVRVVKDDGNWVKTGEALNFLAMTPNTTEYVTLKIMFNAPELDGVFHPRHDRTNDKGIVQGDTASAPGIAQVTAYDTNSDGAVDKWVIKPVQPEPGTYPATYATNQANLSQYLPISGKGKTKFPPRDCNQGDFDLPFELVVTLPQ